MESVYGSNANLDDGVVPKVGTSVIEAALLVQRAACFLLLLVLLQCGDDSVFMVIDSDRRLTAADFVGVKEPLPENEDAGETASQGPEDKGDGEGDGDDDDGDDDEEEDEDEDDEDEDEEDDEDEDAQSQPPSKKKK
ncbi:uncharacterized protein J3R85_000665 [Psidium guajava]|nr:uncharacterized protein J3R85_000665 [Psidium guajava]